MGGWRFRAAVPSADCAGVRLAAAEVAAFVAGGFVGVQDNGLGVVVVVWFDSGGFGFQRAGVGFVAAVEEAEDGVVVDGVAGCAFGFRGARFGAAEVWFFADGARGTLVGRHGGVRGGCWLRGVLVVGG